MTADASAGAPEAPAAHLPAGVRLRVPEPQGWDACYDALLRVFGVAVESPEEREFWRGVADCDRFLAAYDGDDVVGTAGSYAFRVSVPGGAVVPMAGVTMVTVQPTHRRRGLLTAMMRRQLDDFHARGEALAGLIASEPAIYGRFGYGNASAQMSVQVDTGRVRIEAPEGVDEVRLRIADPEAVLDDCERVYAAGVAGRPGMLARQPGWERQGVVDGPANRGGATALQCVVASRDGEVTGYARYAVKSEWGTGGPDGSVLVRVVDAVDPVSRAALWRYLFGIDLTSTLTARNLPADDPLLHLVSDVRRLQAGVRDSLFVRLVDVGAALASRCYATPVEVVLEVSDPFCPWNEGRWRLLGDAKGASCERTTAHADLALSVRELGSVFLGGYSLAALARAGRVQELREGALAEASTAFLSDVAPWLPHGF
jgi:predicted acetyltransferase